ncbi:MAG: hypothetical protein ACRCZZ_03135 [Phocaeicola sp.]
MKKKESYLFNKTTGVAIVTTLLLLMILSYSMAPESSTFEWNSLNPLLPLSGILFLLAFGIGIPTWLAGVVTFLLLFLFCAAIRKIIQLLQGIR